MGGYDESVQLPWVVVMATAAGAAAVSVAVLVALVLAVVAAVAVVALMLLADELCAAPAAMPPVRIAAAAKPAIPLTRRARRAGCGFRRRATGLVWASPCVH
jgi:hypothetical protein